MIKGILGYKRGMSRIYTEAGLIVPVTVIEAGPCTITQIKTAAQDGYTAVQIGFGEIKAKRLTSAQRGHLAASGGENLRHLREFRVDDVDGMEVGGRIDVSAFEAGEKVQVSGVSRGLGFAGTIKRHNFSRQRKTHGQTDRERAPGSAGAGTSPGRTFKGKRSAGRMGGERVTVRNLEVVIADLERNLLAVRGAIPGHDGSLVIVRAVSLGGR
jgi:large subunit ribosomal protein L3